MNRMSFARSLAAIVALTAVLNTLSALSMPVADRKAPLVAVVLWLGLLLVHAAAYLLGDRIRRRFGLPAYAVLQGIIVFLVAVSRTPFPVPIVVFIVCTIELIVLAGKEWGTIQITVGAIALYVLAAFLTSDLYRATTSGLILALTGMIGHAIAALIRRRPDAPVSVIATQRAPGLSTRETEVLRELVSGARNSDIANKLGISERTVKAHLATIYQKLGVESRSAAVATAMQRKLI
jgi:DNA-binding CsgD family transcriptional regulator